MAKPSKNKKQEQDRQQTTTSVNGRRQAENKGYTGGTKPAQSSSGSAVRSSGSSKTNRTNANSTPATKTNVQTGTANTRGRSGQTERGVSNTVSAPKIVSPAAAIRSNPVQSTQGVNLAPGGSANVLARAAAQAYENQQNRRNAAYSTLNRFSGAYDAGEDSRTRSHRQAMQNAAFDRYASTFAPSMADVAQFGNDRDSLRGIATQKAAYDYTKRVYGDWLDDADNEVAKAEGYKQEVENAYSGGYITKSEYDDYLADVDAYLNTMQENRNSVISDRDQKLDYSHGLAEIIRAGKGYSGGASGDAFHQYALPEEMQAEFDFRGDGSKFDRDLEDWFRSVYALADQYEKRGLTDEAQSLRDEADDYWTQAKTSLGTHKWGPGSNNFFGAGYSIIGGFKSFQETDSQASRDAQINVENADWRDAQSEADSWLQRWQDGEQGAYAKYLEAKKKADSLAVDTPVDLSLPGQQWNLRSQALWNASKEGLGEPGKLAMSAVQSVIQQIPYLVIGALTGGAGIAAGVDIALASRLGAAASIAGMSTMAAGNYMTNATQAGLGSRDALQEGVLMGGVEALTEYMAVGDVINLLLSPTSRKIWMNIARVAAEEGIEEMIAEPLDYGVQLFYQDPNAQISYISILEAGATGALAGLGLGGLSSVAGRAIQSKIRTRAEMREELLKKFLESQIDRSDAEELADYYDKKYGDQYEQDMYDTQQERISDPSEMAEQRVSELPEETSDISAGDIASGSLSDILAEKNDSFLNDSIQNNDYPENNVENLNRTVPVSETPADDASRQFDLVRAFASGRSFGKNGKSALTSSYEVGSDADSYIRDFTQVYNRALSGDRLTDAFGSLSEKQVLAAVDAARNDVIDNDRRFANGVTRAADSGASFDDVDRKAFNSRERKYVDRIAQAFGVRVHLVDEMDGNGSLEGNDITISRSALRRMLDNNPDHQSFLDFIFGHESTHRLQSLAPTDYASFRQIFLSLDNASELIDVEFRNNPALSRAEAIDEAVATYAGSLWHDTDSLHRFAKAADRSLLGRFINWLKGIVNKLTGADRRNANNAIYILEQAYRNAAKNAGNIAWENNSNESIPVVSDPFAKSENSARNPDDSVSENNDIPDLASRSDQSVIASSDTFDSASVVEDSDSSSHPVDVRLRKWNESSIFEKEVAVPPDIKLVDWSKRPVAQKTVSVPDDLTSDEIADDKHNRANMIRDMIAGMSDYYGHDFTSGYFLNLMTDDEILEFNITHELPFRIRHILSFDDDKKGRTDAVVYSPESLFTGNASYDGYLVAIRGLSEETLEKALNRGSIAMPSIAVVPPFNAAGFFEYGENFLLFGSDTINPAVDKRNYIFSEDGFTPVEDFDTSSLSDEEVLDRMHLKGVTSYAAQNGVPRINSLEELHRFDANSPLWESRKGESDIVSYGELFKDYSGISFLDANHDSFSHFVSGVNHCLFNQFSDIDDFRNGLSDYGIDLSSVHDFDSLFSDYKNMLHQSLYSERPYYEAKPDRIVGLNEAVSAVVSDNVPKEQIEKLKSFGISVFTYPWHSDKSVISEQVLNAISVEGVRFSSTVYRSQAKRYLSGGSFADGSFANKVMPQGVVYDWASGDDIVNTDSNIRYSLSDYQDRDPKYIRKMYKAFALFEDYPGELFSAMVQFPGGRGTPQLVWVQSDSGKIARDEIGRPYVNTKGRVSVVTGGSTVNAAPGSFGWRGGLHGGVKPVATQFDIKNNLTGENKALFRSNLVWAECDYYIEYDYQLEAIEYGVNEKGVYIHTQGGCPYIPHDGAYAYRTNPDKTTDPWVITGAFRIGRIITDEEAESVLVSRNSPNRNKPRSGRTPAVMNEDGSFSPVRGKDTRVPADTPLDLGRFGLSFDEPLPGNSDFVNKEHYDESVEAAMYWGYKRRPINFDDPATIAEFQMIEDNGWNPPGFEESGFDHLIDYYRDIYEKTNRRASFGEKGYLTFEDDVRDIPALNKKYAAALEQWIADGGRERMASEQARWEANGRKLVDSKKQKKTKKSNARKSSTDPWWVRNALDVSADDLDDEGDILSGSDVSLEKLSGKLVTYFGSSEKLPDVFRGFSVNVDPSETEFSDMIESFSEMESQKPGFLEALKSLPDKPITVNSGWVPTPGDLVFYNGYIYRYFGEREYFDEEKGRMVTFQRLNPFDYNAPSFSKGVPIDKFNLGVFLVSDLDERKSDPSKKSLFEDYSKNFSLVLGAIDNFDFSLQRDSSFDSFDDSSAYDISNLEEIAPDDSNPAGETLDEISDIEIDDYLSEMYANELIEAAYQFDRAGRYEANDYSGQREGLIYHHQDEPTVAEKIKEGADTLYRGYVDTGAAVMEMGKEYDTPELYELFNLAKASSSTCDYMIGKAMVDASGKVVGESLESILKPIKDKGGDYWDDFQLYVYHLQNIDRISSDEDFFALRFLQDKLRQWRLDNPEYKDKNEKDIYREANYAVAPAIEYVELRESIEKLEEVCKPVFGWDFNKSDSQKAASGLESQYPEFTSIASRLYAYSDHLMDFRLQTGLISEEEADAMRKAYPHYVPTMHYSDAVGKSIIDEVNIGKTVHRAKFGGSDPLVPLDEALAGITRNVVREGRKNQFGGALVRAGVFSFDRAGDVDGKYVLGYEISRQDRDKFRDWQDDLLREVNTNHFTVRFGGKRITLTLSDAMMDGINSLTTENNVIDTPLLEFVRRANTFYKELITTYNPMFMIRNFAMDIQDAALFSKDPKKFFKNYPLALKEISGNGSYWQQYCALGGAHYSYYGSQHGGVYSGDISSLRKVGNSIGQANLIVEQAPRLAEFISTLQNGGTVSEAMLNAADVTVNFGRSGDVTKVQNQLLVPFMNPSIQDFDRLIRTLKGDLGIGLFSLLMRCAAFGIAPSLINLLIGRREKDWDDLTERDRDRNFLIPLGKYYWLRIPRGRVSSAFNALVNNADRIARGKDVDFTEVFSTLASQIGPTNPIKDNIFAPLARIDLFDEDSPGKTWYGGDIETEEMRELPVSQRFDNKTDDLSIFLGEKLNLSPAKIHDLLDSYTGVIGDIGLPLLTSNSSVSRNPFASTFIYDSVTRNNLGSEYYKSRAYVEQLATSGDHAAELAAKAYEYLGEQAQRYWVDSTDYPDADIEISKGSGMNPYRWSKSRVNDYYRIGGKLGEYLVDSIQKNLDSGMDDDQAYASAVASLLDQKDALEMLGFQLSKPERDEFGSDMLKFTADTYGMADSEKMSYLRDSDFSDKNKLSVFNRAFHGSLASAHLSDSELQSAYQKFVISGSPLADIGSYGEYTPDLLNAFNGDNVKTMSAVSDAQFVLDRNSNEANDPMVPEELSILKGLVDGGYTESQRKAVYAFMGKTSATYLGMNPAKIREEYDRYSAIPAEAYTFSKEDTADYVSYKDSSGKAIDNSWGAQVAEYVYAQNYDLKPEVMDALLTRLGVGKTVRGWTKAELAQKLAEFRKKAGVSQ